MGRPALEPGETGSIAPKQIKDRLWTVRVKWRDDAGGYHRTEARGTTKKDCAEVARSRIASERARLATDARSDLTVDEVARLWFTDLASSRRRPSTIAQYQATWRGTLMPVLGAERINDLTRARCQQALREQLFARHPGRLDENTGAWIPGEHRRTEAGELIPLRGEQPRNVLRLLLRFAADRGYRHDGINPLDGTEPPERTKPAPRALTDAEADRLLKMAEHWYLTGHGASDVLCHVLCLLFCTGLRLGEALGLRWSDVDLEADPPTITVSKTLLEPRGNVPMTTGPTKGGTTAVVALHPMAVSVLSTRRAKATEPDDGFIFATRTGRPTSHANVRRALRDLVRGTDLDWVHTHSFRHTLASKAAAVFDDTAAQDLLRHADPAVTRRHYIERAGTRVLDPRGLLPSPSDRANSAYNPSNPTEPS